MQIIINLSINWLEFFRIDKLPIRTILNDSEI